MSDTEMIARLAEHLELSDAERVGWSPLTDHNHAMQVAEYYKGLWLFLAQPCFFWEFESTVMGWRACISDEFDESDDALVLVDNPSLARAICEAALKFDEVQP